jgi:hypothetical protein
MLRLRASFGGGRGRQAGSAARGRGQIGESYGDAARPRRKIELPQTVMIWCYDIVGGTTGERFLQGLGRFRAAPCVRPLRTLSAYILHRPPLPYLPTNSPPALHIPSRQSTLPLPAFAPQYRLPLVAVDDFYVLIVRRLEKSPRPE